MTKSLMNLLYAKNKAWGWEGEIIDNGRETGAGEGMVMVRAEAESPAGEQPAGRFGPFGGQYAPETLMAALTEVSEAYAACRADPDFQAQLDGLLREYVGRPTPLYHARNLSAQSGAQIYLKREDLA